MTKEETWAMKPGRELDKAVGEIVFGYEVKIFQGFAPDLCYQYRTPSEYGETYDFLPFYSTETSVACQVVEKEGAWDIKKRFRPQPDDPPGSGGRPTYQAIVFLSDYDPYEDELINKRTGRSPWCWSLPEAICKAALLAKQ